MDFHPFMQFIRATHKIELERRDIVMKINFIKDVGTKNAKYLF